MVADIRRHSKLQFDLHGAYKLPTQILADTLPNLVLAKQFVTILQNRKVGQILVKLQEFTELVQNIGIGQEVAATRWAMLLE